MSKKILGEKHVVVAVVEVNNSNPNGDKEAHGAPRQDGATGLGLITDVCIKSKFLEAVREMYGDVELFIEANRALNEKFEEAAREAAGMTVAELVNAMKKDRDAFTPVLQYLLERYFDMRTFGAVLAKLNRHVRGPAQFTIAQSVLPVELKTYALTSQGITTDKQFYEEGSNTMFGEKTVVRHGVYVIRGEVSAVQAEQTGFTEDDMEKLLQGMVHMFDFDKAAGRADMRLRGLWDFVYPDRLGLEPTTTTLWESLKVTPVPEVLNGFRPATEFSDYIVSLDEASIPSKITIRKLV